MSRLRTLLALAACLAASVATPGPARADEPVRIKLWVPGVEHVELSRAADGRFVYDVRFDDGRRESLGPDELAALLHDRVRDRPWWHRVLNISSPIGVAWVALGLLGQLAFTARMLFQWWVSERRGVSVVPVGFWWLSLAGASMLLVYFVWRKDVVGILGQSAGWLIYARNLFLIGRARAA